MNSTAAQTVRELCNAANDVTISTVTDFSRNAFYRFEKAIAAAEALLAREGRDADLFAKLQYKADLFDYVCWLESQDPLDMQEYHRCGDALVLASDGTTIWAKTYADAFKLAMQHDKELFDAKPTPNP